MSTPAAYRWTGESFEPLRRFKQQCDREFVIGETYTLAELEERSGAAHRWYFVAVRDAWASLPERLAGEFPTPEALRKFALIKAGFFNRTEHVCASKGEAVRLAAAIRPIDPFAVVETTGTIVRHFTARSQSFRAMPKGEFRASVDAVLDVLAGMVGVEPGELVRHGQERAAA